MTDFAPTRRLPCVACLPSRRGRQARRQVWFKLDPWKYLIYSICYSLQLDASDFITKPVNDEAFHMALKRAQHRFAARKELWDHAALLEKENARTTQELIRSISFQRNLIESSMDGILGCDKEERVVIFHRAMEQMVGFTKDEALNKMYLGQFFT